MSERNGKTKSHARGDGDADGGRPTERRARARRERTEPVWIDPETGIAWKQQGAGRPWKDGVPPSVRRAGAERKKLEDASEQLRQLQAATGVKSKVSPWRLTREQLGAASMEIQHLRDPRNQAAWKKWKGAAKRFRGLGEHMKAEYEMRNIRLHPGGYQVVIHRNNEEFSRCFAGFSEEVLQSAMEFRDALVAQAPRIFAHPIPQHVLDELGFKEPAIGVTHWPKRSCFRVSAPPCRILQNFYYRRVSQADAYAAGIEFREVMLAHKYATAG